jgi:hypothetical protein
MVNTRKRPLILRLFLRLLIFICILICIVAGWIVFASVDKVPPFRVIPGGYSLFVRTDSVWNAVSPVLDLQAADTILADPSFSKYRPVFMSLRSSELRANKYVQFAASRRAEMALYTSENRTDYAAAIDMSFLSALTRFADILGPNLKITNLYYKKASPFSYFEYHTEDSVIFLKQRRNLVIAANSIDMLTRCLEGDNESSYTQNEKKLLGGKVSGAIQFVADAKKIALQIAQGSTAAESMTSFLTDGAHSMLTFDISDSGIDIKAEFPFTLPEKSDSPFVPILSRNSPMPGLLTRLGDTVQYYTLLNAGPFSELKDAAFPLIRKEKNADTIWKKGESLSKIFFSLSLEDILFSWTGNECAVLGIEGNSDPVFVLKVRDEKQRKKVFDSIVSSFVVENNTNLIIGGVRLPCLEMPPFLNDILVSFNIELPRPYYLVQDGYIYFSESPQNLSSIYNDSREGRMLARNAAWKSVSENQNPSTTLSLYYNLQRSVPFFFENGTMLSKILRLYNIGRCDFRVKDNILTCQLHAVSCSTVNMRIIPGFPLQTGNVTDYNLQRESGKNDDAVFWVEDGIKIKSLELASMKQYELSLPDSCTIVASEEKAAGGVLWAVTEKGAVYLLDRKLECAEAFPVITGALPSAQCSSYGSSLLIPSRDGSVVQVSADGVYKLIPVCDGALFKSAPVVLNENAVVYNKGFHGTIYLIKNGACVNSGSPMEIDGIGFGSPSLVEKNHILYTAFITQAGRFYLFADGKPVSGFPLDIPNVFYTNVVSCGSFFFALSQDAQLYRIGFDGSFTSVKIPDALSAKQGFIASVSSGVRDDIYICADGNVLYGFDETLEILRDFPLAGRSRPVFSDVNGDRKKDCLVLSTDKKLYAWNLK